jgi:SAM-dependent methyltransferase
MNRKQTILQCIDLSKGKGLELGPLFSPVVTKDEAKIFYVDHMSTEDLKKKYNEDYPIKDSPVAVEKIVPVDYALNDKSLKETLKGKKFDYVIASHVIEHIPDVVSWLKDVHSILNDGGILSLVIPDKRFTFDILRNESRPADIIGAYLDKQTRASSATMYDYVSSFRYNIVAAHVWDNPLADHSRKKKNSAEKAYQMALQNLDPAQYVDSHCSVFTPYSFCNILRSLIEHNLLDYEVAAFKQTPKYQLEFFVSLRKVSKKVPAAQKLKSIPKLKLPTEKHQLEAAFSKLKAEEVALQNEAASLRAELDHVKSSKSWQITKPVRGATRVAKKIIKK